MGKYKKIELIILSVLIVVLSGAVGYKVFLAKKDEPVQDKEVKKVSEEQPVTQPEPEPEESEPEPEESQPELKESRVTEPQESGQEQVKPEGEEIRTADSPITGEDNSILYFLYIIFLLCAIVCHTKHLSEIQS